MGTHMVTANTDHSMRIWQFKTQEPLMILHGHHDLVSGAQFLNDSTVVSSSWDCSVMVHKI
jgi:WD40 repeat protein